MKRILILAGLVAMALAIWRKGPATPSVLTGRAMGSDWKLVTDDPVDERSLRPRVAAEIERWEQVLSTWRSDSDLSRFNRGEPATEDLQRVIELAERLRRESAGAFDHRMLRQLGEAGFGPGGTGIDLSSLGKGFAVDRVAEMLRSMGIRRFVFSIAGEVRAGEGAWPVVIERPDGSGTAARTIFLSNKSLATSGNYRQIAAIDGDKIVSHILDPTTGKPVLRPPSSVTVIGPDTAVASGWATAMFVRGPDEWQLAEARGYQVVWQEAGAARAE